MKKILTALILLTFCTVQMTWAGDVIIIGSDGQARYEDESKNIPVTKEDIEKAKKKRKNILNEVTITDETGKRENIYINGRGKVKKVEEEQITQVVQPVDKDKEVEHQKYIQNMPKILSGIDPFLSQYGYSKKDNSSKSGKEYMKMALLDGDYVIGYKDAPYIAEYHKDGSLMGLVKIDEQVLDKDDTTVKKADIVFYEYRLGYNTTDNDSMGLKHVLFLDYEKENYLAQYIYKHDGTLLCRQINNDIYVSSEARNMIPDWSKRYNNLTSSIRIHSKNNNKSKIIKTVITIPKYALVGLCEFVDVVTGLVFFIALGPAGAGMQEELFGYTFGATAELLTNKKYTRAWEGYANRGTW